MSNEEIIDVKESEIEKVKEAYVGEENIIGITDELLENLLLEECKYQNESIDTLTDKEKQLSKVILAIQYIVKTVQKENISELRTYTQNILLNNKCVRNIFSLLQDDVISELIDKFLLF